MNELVRFRLTKEAVSHFVTGVVRPLSPTEIRAAQNRASNARYMHRKRAEKGRRHYEFRKQKNSVLMKELRAKRKQQGLDGNGKPLKNKPRPELAGLIGREYRHAYYLLTGDNGARPRRESTPL